MIGDRRLHVDEAEFCVNVAGDRAEQTGSALRPGTEHADWFPTSRGGGAGFQRPLGVSEVIPVNLTSSNGVFPGKNSGFKSKSADDPPEKMGERAGNLVGGQAYSAASLYAD